MSKPRVKKLAWYAPEKIGEYRKKGDKTVVMGESLHEFDDHNSAVIFSRMVRPAAAKKDRKKQYDLDYKELHANDAKAVK